MADENLGIFTCPVCKGTAFLPGRKLFDDRYGHPDEFEVKACAACGHHKTFPPIAEKDLGALYSRYYPRSAVNPTAVLEEARTTGGPDKRFWRWWNGSRNQGQYSAHAGETYLDVGCGNGGSLIEAKLAGADAFGIEADPNVARIAEALGVEIAIGSIFDDPFPGRKFDLISLNQVIEHLPEPDRALEVLKGRLAAGGRLFLACPNRRSLVARLAGDRWLNWHIPFHLNHFDRQSLSAMARRCGFRVRRVQTITPNVWLLLQMRTLQLTPVRGVASKFWMQSLASTDEAADEVPDAASVTVRRRGVLGQVKRMVRLTATLGIGVVARLLDVLGLGESLVVVLEPDTGK